MIHVHVGQERNTKSVTVDKTKNMNICICGSLHFFEQMEEAKLSLEELGHEVKMPPKFADDMRGGQMGAAERWQASKDAGEEETWVWDMKESAMQKHFEKVAWSDAVLIINEEKKGVSGYIGANTLLEMGLAFYLRKQIFLLNQVPELDYKDEILGMRPVIISRDLSKIF